MTNRLKIIAILILILVNILIYGQSARFEFVNFDDHGYVTENPSIQALDYDHIKEIFSSPFVSNYQPVSVLSYAIDYSLYGLDPAGYHITNTVIHTINSVLLFFLLLLITNNGWLSFIIALLFGVHPMQVESVAWVSERKGIMCASFFMLSFIAYISAARKDKIAYYLLSIFLFLLALLSKPVAITFPFILLMFDYHEDKIDRTGLFKKIPYFALSAALIIVTVIAQKDTGAINLDQLSTPLNFLHAFYNIGFYIFNLLLPINLSSYYEYPLIPAFLSQESFFSLVVIAGTAAWIKNFKKIDKTVNFGIAFFFISLLLVLRFVPIGLTFAADRYVYIPIIGLFLAIAVLLNSITSKRPRLKSLLILALPLYIIFLGVLSYNRCDVWANSYNLWANALEYNPSSKYVRIYYNEALFNLGRGHLIKNEFEPARSYYTQVLDYYSTVTLDHDIDMSSIKGDTVDEIKTDRKLSDYYLLKVKKKTLYDIGMSYLYENRLNESEKYFTSLVDEFPGNAKGFLQLGNINDMTGRPKDAARLYKQSLELDPDDPHTHYNYAVSLENLGDIDNAVKHYKLAIEYDDKWALPRKALNRINRAPK